MAAALVVGLAGDYGIHRVQVLPIAGRLVAAAGVGFAADGKTPFVVKDKRLLLWSNGLDRSPVEHPLPFSAPRAAAVAPGQLAVGGLTQATRFTVPGGSQSHTTTIQGKIQQLVATPLTLQISTAAGELLHISADGVVSRAPRPTSVSGRRFTAFRETGPMKYGDTLAAFGERWVASATLDGCLAVLDRARGRLLIAPEPQFELAEPIVDQPDPILYETENT